MALDNHILYGTISPLPDGQALAIYYLHNEPLTKQEFTRIAKTLPGYIQAVWCPKLNELAVQYVNSTKSGIGVGTALLALCVQEGQKAGLTSVTLDDMSDRFMQEHNLYLNMGMTYKEPYLPEMIGSSETILDCWESVKHECINPQLQYLNSDSPESYHVEAVNTPTSQEQETLSFLTD
jgi:hypothetical protein